MLCSKLCDRRLDSFPLLHIEIDPHSVLISSSRKMLCDWSTVQINHSVCIHCDEETVKDSVGTNSTR